LPTKHSFCGAQGSCLDGTRRIILFHNKCHPDGMGAQEIQAFRVWLATQLPWTSNDLSAGQFSMIPLSLLDRKLPGQRRARLCQPGCATMV